MINLTIKTLDSSNHEFSVEDETTVQQLKEKIREQMNIDIGLQRLIFCGRVLQDDFRLADLGVHGKVIHLVERAPPPAEERNRVRTRQSAQSGSGVRHNGVDPNSPQSSTGVGVRTMGGTEIMTVTPTAGRMEFIRRLIGEIKGSFASLGASTNISQVNSGASASNRDDSTEQMDTDPYPADSQEETETTLEENEEVADLPTRLLHARRRNQRTNRAVRLRNTRPRDLVMLLDELDRLHAEFAPYRSHYMRLLAGASSGVFAEYTPVQQREVQHVVDLIVDVIHSFAHAYHAISDISFIVDNRNPRLTSDAPNMLRHQFPMQAHINVIHARRQRPNPVSTSTPITANNTEQQSSVSEINTSSPTGHTDDGATIGTNSTINTHNRNITPPRNSTEDNISSVSSGSSTPAAQNANEPNESGSSDSDNEPHNNGGESQTANRGTNLTSEIRRTYALGRNTTQPIVNINIQPDPVTYQVEIETRLPIAFALENSLLSGLVNQSTNQQAPQSLQSNTQQRNAEPNNAQQDNAQQGGPNRRHTFQDIENMVRGLGTPVGNTAGPVSGVEVVMSMEDFNNEFLSDVFDRNTITSGSSDVVGSNTTSIENTSATLSSSSALGNNTYTRFNTPIRGVQPAEVFAAPMQWGSPPDNLLHNIVSSVIRQGMEGVALHIPGQNVQARGNNTTQDNQNNHAQRTGASQDQNTPNQPRQFSAAESTGAIPRVAQPMSMANMIYDRYLACDNQYARRRLQRRRDIHLMQLAAQERVLADRQAVRSLDTLRERFGSLLTLDHMDHMNTLLRNDPTPETWFNALLVLLARHIYVNDPMQRRGNEPGMTPVEFHSVRAQLRNYMFNLLQRSGGTINNAYGPTIDYLLNQYADFINNMENITPLIPYCNIWGTLRSILRSRMPALVGVVTTNSEGGDLYANRFYLVFTRLFVDICSLIFYHCVNGLDGLRLIYKAFLELVLQNMDESDRPLFEILAMGNLRAVENDLQANVATIEHHIKRLNPKDKQGGSSEDNESMTQESSNIDSQDESNLDQESSNIDSQDESNLDEAQSRVQPDIIPQAPSAMEVTPHIPIEELMQTSPDIEKSTEDKVDDSTEVAEEPILMSTAGSSTSSAKTPVKKTPRKLRVVPSSKSPSRSSLPRQPEATSSQGSPDQQDVPSRETSPIMLLRHWNDEWLPLFTRDHERQREALQAPYSDAYLSGMPSRKRRRVREAKPPVTLDAFMNESVREATERTSPVDNSSVRVALREHMRNIARTRAVDSEDYDTRLHACAARFLRDPSPPKQEQVESSDESPEKH